MRTTSHEWYSLRYCKQSTSSFVSLSTPCHLSSRRPPHSLTPPTRHEVPSGTHARTHPRCRSSIWVQVPPEHQRTSHTPLRRRLPGGEGGEPSPAPPPAPLPPAWS